jgi:type I restriction enzyme S subunit
MSKIKLYEIAEVSSGQGAPQGDNEYSKTGTPFVKAGNLLDLVNGLSIDSIQKVTEETAKKYKLKKFQKGTVVFAKSGMSCLKGYVYTLPIDAYVVNHLACIIPYKNTSEYLRYYFMYHKPSELVKDSSYPSIRLSDISNIELKLPKENEMNSIVSSLELITRIIKSKAQVLLEYDQLIKSRFVEMFEKSNDYEKKPLVDVTIKIGSGATPLGGNQVYIDEGISLIRSMNVYDNSFEYNDLAHIKQKQADRLKNVIVEPGDILFNITGASVCRTCIVPNDVLPARVNQHTSIIRVNNQYINNYYLLYYLMRIKQDLLKISKSGGATREAITKIQLENIEVILPPLKVQEEFAIFSCQINKLKFAVQKSLNETQSLFDSLMQTYFG